MLIITNLDRLVAYHTWTYETGVRSRLVDFSARAGRPITSMASILDLEGVSSSVASSATRSYIGRASATDSAHYPETLGKMFIINVPSFFAAFWLLIKGFFDERTTRKIEIIAAPSAWRPRIKEVLGDANTPIEYGGSLKVDHIFHHR